ncbi:hypothetical protein STCU_09346 [Strigomonas culicis]|uniref:Nodulin-like domain-containing protein n=1 Tax=Strigomonas culicis TaxID=28005 RepID=S9TN17_9TRYP|nr:hypothetical protein STCU_09346 [Strigomonas culicis]|eukprot:EPY19657.1 hypothetical protein STCU_09346 [Strigomonas culicis]
MEQQQQLHPKWSEWTLEKKWFLHFFVSILLSINNAACFCFGIFSPFMKTGAFGYTQFQVSVVSTVGVLLSYFSIPTGFLYDKKGPTATLFVGTILNVVGWMGMYVIFYDLEQPVLSNSVLVMCIFFGLSQLSASFYETGSVLTNLKSFSCYQGRVILIQKTFMGLGSSIVAQINLAFIEEYTTGIAPFLSFLFTFSLISGVLGVLFVKLPTPQTRAVGLNVADADTIARGGGEPTLFARPFRWGTAILFFAVAYVLVVTLVENYVTLGTGARALVGVLTVLLCFSFTSMIFVTPSFVVNVGGFRGDAAALHGAVELDPAAKAEAVAYCEDRRQTCVVEDLGDAVRTPLPDPSYGTEIGTTSVVPVPGATAPLAQKAWHSSLFVEKTGVLHLNISSLVANFSKREIWLLWYICFASWGCMTLTSSNSSQVYQALCYDTFSLTTNTVYVSIFGVASALGRVVVGYAFPFMERFNYSIASFLVFSPLFNVVGLPLFLIIPGPLLFVPFFIIGLSTGISWGSTVLVVTSLFAPNNCGKHYSWLYTAGMLSPVVFNMALFGPWYDHNSSLQGRVDRSCKGVACLWLPFILCGLVNLLAVPVALHFTRRISSRGGIL